MAACISMALRNLYAHTKGLAIDGWSLPSRVKSLRTNGYFIYGKHIVARVVR